MRQYLTPIDILNAEHDRYDVATLESVQRRVADSKNSGTPCGRERATNPGEGEFD